MKKISLGILGCGTVGGALAGFISAKSSEIQNRTGIQLEIAKIGVKSVDKPRPEISDQSLLPLLTEDLESVVKDSDLVVELMGGISPARDLLMSALAASKSVVTANKELISSYGPELAEAAEKGGARLAFEASAGGAIPIVRTLQKSLPGEPITRISGILNGTTNYILSAMTEAGIGYDAALQKARELGYAEADPSDDISGKDAASKLAILASAGFFKEVRLSDVYFEGIEGIHPQDIIYAGHLGYVLKLLSIAELAEGKLAIRTHPSLVPVAHQLAKVGDSFNAAYIEGDQIGELMLYGYGAGGAPTASAVLGDILDIASAPNDTHLDTRPKAEPPEILGIEDLSAPYYLRLEVEDSPGVLAAVADVFGTNGVSIKSMEQLMEPEAKDLARLIFITHRAKESDFQKTLAGLKKLKAVKNIDSTIRVFDF